MTLHDKIRDFIETHPDCSRFEVFMEGRYCCANMRFVPFDVEVSHRFCLMTTHVLINKIDVRNFILKKLVDAIATKVEAGECIWDM